MGETELITEVGPNDVLFGRGSGPNSHDGNVRFRALVNQRKEEYLRTNHRQTKVKIASEIVDTVLAAGGRFLKRAKPSEVAEKGLEEGEEVWCAVDHDTMMEKAKQALRQNLDKPGNKDSMRRNSMTSSDTYESPRGGMVSPRIVTPGMVGNPADLYEPDPMRDGGPVMPQQQQFSSANIEAWTNYATAQVNNSGMGGAPSMPFSSTSTPQQQVMSELCGSMEISDLIQSIVNVRKDDYFAASDPQTKAMIARQIVDAALAESNRARQNLTSSGGASHPYEALLQQNTSAPMPSGMVAQAATNGYPQASPMGGGGFNLYTMARGRTSSGQNQFPSNGISPPQTTSSNVADGQMDGVADVTISNNYAFDRPKQQRSMDRAPKREKEALPDGFNLIGGFPAAAAGKTKNRSSQNHRDTQPSDDQSLDERMMLEQYLHDTLTPGDSSSAILDGPDLVGMTDQDSIGTFNQSASELESMAESVSIMSYNSKPKGGIDSFLSANAPKNRRLGGSKKSSRKNAALKTHFSLEDQKASKSRKGGASVMSSSMMSGRSHKSNRSTKSNKSTKSKSSVRDDISIMSGVSNFSGMTNNTDHLSLMSEMTDLSEALNSLDLAGDYSQILK